MYKVLITAAVALASLATSEYSHAEYCGEFRFSGWFENMDNRVVLIVFKESGSETIISISPELDKRWQFQVGRYSAGRILIRSAAGAYRRTGEVIESRLEVPDLLAKNRGDYLETISETECVANDAADALATMPADPSFTNWARKHDLDKWPFAWESVVLESYDDQFVPPEIVAHDLERVRFGTLDDQRVLVFLPGCMCSSMGTKVLAFSEQGARLVVDAHDTITEVAFRDSFLHVTHDDDPDAANCCAERFRHTRWSLKGISFEKVEVEHTSNPHPVHGRPNSAPD